MNAFSKCGDVRGRSVVCAGWNNALLCILAPRWCHLCALFPLVSQRALAQE